MSKNKNLLNQFDTESTSENGAWLHLVLPSTGEPSYLDEKQEKPLRIKLKGPDSNAWVNFQRKALRNNDKNDRRTTKELANEDSKLFAKMTIEVENIPDIEKPSEEQLVEMYVTYKDIRIQALTFVMNRENFTKGSENN